MNKKLAVKAFRYASVLLLAVIWAVPLYITLITPFKSTRELFTQALALPTSYSIQNYVRVFQEVNFFRYLKNSLIVTAGALAVLSMLASLAAYALFRTRSRLTSKVYFLFSMGMMIPTQAAMIALFNVIKGLGLYNTYIGLMLAYGGCYMPVSVFLFTGFFKSGIPHEIIESAYIDCGNEFVIYSRIVLPLSASAFGTVLIYNSIQVWKDFTYPLIFTQGESVTTLPMAIYSLKGEYMSDYPMIFAGVIASSIPLLVVYLLLQKQFVAGITAGAVKG